MRTYVADLSVLMENPAMLRRMTGDRVVIPWAVLIVLDKLKDSEEEDRKRAARRAILALHEVSDSLTALIEGVKTPYGVTVQVVKEYEPVSDQPDSLSSRTMGTALLLRGRGQDVAILTRKESVAAEARRRRFVALIIEKEETKEKGGDNMGTATVLRQDNKKPSVAWCFVLIGSLLMMISGLVGGGAFFGLGLMGAAFSGVMTYKLISSDISEINEHKRLTQTEAERKADEEAIERWEERKVTGVFDTFEDPHESSRGPGHDIWLEMR